MTNDPSGISRRALLTGSLAAAVLGGLAACSDDDSTSAPSVAPTPAFPTTIDHVYGKTTIEAEPKRIVVVGYNEQDALLALGVAPVAVTQWIGDEPYAVFPWSKDKLGDAKPTVMESAEGLDLDEVKKLKPDLIIGTNAGLGEADYDELTKIAPTLPNSGSAGNDYYEPWQTQTTVIGQAIGRSDQAKQLVDALVQRFADAAVAHPQWDQVPAGFVQAPYDDGSVIAWPDGLGTDFLTDLGFTIPKSFTKYVDKEVAQAQIPGSKATVLNEAKVLVWGVDTDGDGSDIQNDKILGKLDAVKEGRSVYAGETLTSAIYFNSVLSLPYVLDHLVPELEQVLPA